MDVRRNQQRSTSSLDPLVEQLWFAVPGGVRVSASGAPADGWIDAESYVMVPARNPRLLLPDSEPPSTRGALGNYQGLRAGRQQVARAGLRALHALGAPTGRRVRLQVREDQQDARAELPLSRLAQALGTADLRASVGIRTGANRKATLQLVDPAGRPVGYAKLGWNDVTDEYVRTEAAALEQVGGGAGRMRAPAALASFSYGGHPVVVTAPLPPGVRAIRGKVPAPTSEEIFALTPVVRHAAPRETAHVAALRERLGSLRAHPSVVDQVEVAQRLLAKIDDVDEALPVGERWHGDLSPWNCARDEAGTLWAWDWESSEVDALAGLDAIHWALSEQRETRKHGQPLRLPDAVDASRTHLVAAGVARSHRRTVGQVYALTVIERACALAASAGGWDSLWISPAEVRDLVDQASGALR